MEEEIKKAYMDWSEKGVSYLNCMYVYDTMMDVDEALQTCDTILDEIDLGIDYTSRKKDIDRLLEGHGTLHRYIDVLNCYVDDKLDQPLKKDFKKNATETISRIHLEDFEVDNTLGLTENNYITGGMGYAGTMVEQEKAKLAFADFIGTSDGKADGNGFHMAYTNGSVEDFASIFAAQYEAMKASGALGEDNNLTQQEFLEQFYRQGEFTHDSSNPFLNFVSSVLDITIIKPIIEACTGEDLITGEDLTDMERGLKVVFAVVDLVTLGGAIAATKFSEMGLKEGLKAFGKTALIDFAGNTAACGVGALGETFDWPVPITMMLSLAAGITVSISGNKLLFKNADGIEIGSKTLNEREWESFRDLMSPEEAARYDKYWSLKETTCTSDELYIYLKNIDTDYAETFLKTGEWPDEIQIPKNASVLNKDGSINWTKAAKGGYKLDKDGNPIKEKFIPKIGEVIDRYGPANGRYTSPIIDGKSFEYTERSLPYVENLSNYHKYEVIGDFSKIEEYVKNCPDAKLKVKIDATVTAYYDGDYSKLVSYKGEAATVEGWGKGGAIQYEFSLTVEQLEGLGLLREIK
ncbi:glycohydrolase toxin TNT-related protein [Agathobacter rectalis]|uniref:Glycohydrolase toxin TNT-related protein n=3 Tax=Agathobacter rectalis TaxID=39491 RepID=A0AAX0BJT1_9FIRM|nr:pre-toxin TG domain-containing protein [Agathobacter rectalis]NSC28671.1 glycohydrolase toxin TNT-related protein [Agathobacter rectalis]NSC37856.1 glycohydrolase toxin TNT-related protein [Agathobacter rectalis]NSC54484.1 glycohydrolase toxin TNT-related protein [Agathobacter rectalis]NSC60506.1 glycohydrolase toxin TNT-related protein [Agathobacter rectalis]NSC66168.1 glycohydrolase toxin TNT-related protein [Agathobacter rectalis]